MKQLIIVLASIAVLSGCTGHHLKKPPVCNGKHRRPANLYGTILPSLPVPLPGSQQGQVQPQSQSVPTAPTAPFAAPPTPAATPGPQGAMNLPTSFHSC